MNGNSAFTILVDKAESGVRLDIVISKHLPDCSRSMINGLIRGDHVHVQGKTAKPGYRVRTGDEIRGLIPPPQPLDCKPEPIEIDIRFEDAHMLVLNKQAGRVVHPAPGNISGTLVNALLYHCPGLGRIGNAVRPGIVHRLDKDTSGTLVVAKTAVAHRNLSEQFKVRKVRKTYLALVYGTPRSESGTIDLPIGRHPVDRKRMSTTSHTGRSAETWWWVKEAFTGATLLNVDIRTGRTHQIRVHCAAEGHPVVGDAVYGKRRSADRYCREKSVTDLLKSTPRQMLHAKRLELDHPVTGERMVFDSPVPKDMSGLIDALRTLHGTP